MQKNDVDLGRACRAMTSYLKYCDLGLRHSDLVLAECVDLIEQNIGVDQIFIAVFRSSNARLLQALLETHTQEELCSLWNSHIELNLWDGFTDNLRSDDEALAALRVIMPMGIPIDKEQRFQAKLYLKLLSAGFSRSLAFIQQAWPVYAHTANLAMNLRVVKKDTAKHADLLVSCFEASDYYPADFESYIFNAMIEGHLSIAIATIISHPQLQRIELYSDIKITASNKYLLPFLQNAHGLIQLIGTFGSPSEVLKLQPHEVIAILKDPAKKERNKDAA